MGVSRRVVVTLSVTAGALMLLANFHTSSGSSNLTVGNGASAAATTATTDVTGTASVGSPTTAGAPPPPTTPSSTAPPSTAAPPSTGASTAPPPPRSVAPTSAPPPPVATSAKARTVDGPVIGTPYGDVQVRVVLRASHIVDVQPLTLPSDRSRSRRISELAAPLLRTEVLQAQSANIDLLSGASYTSEGYAESLQGALDAARS